MTQENLVDSLSDNSSFDNLVEEVSDRLHQGESVDIDRLTADCPDHRDRLRTLLPTVQAMATMGQVAESVVPAMAGESLGDFRLLREIGRGGMGVVYEARQISLDRRVALKLLPFASVLEPRRVQRFKNEALAVAQLDHPHIVDVYGVGCERGVHYYAMRYIDGRPLSEIISRTRELERNTQQSSKTRKTDAPTHQVDSLAADTRPDSTRDPEDIREAVRIAFEVASALEHAHQQGIIHRDVKPANVLIGSTGKAWIADFGLARHETDTSVTRTGDVIGTLRYMSPEQIAGRRAVIDHRTDVYSLGATLYELLTLRPAFPSDDRSDLLRQIIHEDPPRLRRWNKRIPAELETIVLKSVAKLPFDRYATARELADDLDRFLNHRPVKARPPSVITSLRKWMRRHATFVWSAGVSMVLALILGTAMLDVSNYMIRAEQARTRQAMSQLKKSQLLAQRTAQIAHNLERLKEAQVWLVRGRWYQDQRRWDDAWQAFTKAVELRPENADGWMERAELFTTLGLWDHAVADYQSAFDLGRPDVAHLWHRYALLVLITGDQDGYRRIGEQMFERFHGTLKPSMAIDLVRTCSLQFAEQTADAPAWRVELASKFLRSNPEAALPRYVLGLALYRNGQFAAAAEACQRSVETDPTWPARFINYPVIAMAHARLGQRNEARQALLAASDAMERWTGALLHQPDENWIVHQGALGDWPVPWFDWLESRYLYREAAKMIDETRQVDDAWQSVFRARAMAGLRWHEQADGEYAAALKASPHDQLARLEFHRNRGAWLAKQADWKRSATEYERASELDPRDVILWNSQAITHFLSGDLAAYRQTCEQLLEHFESTSNPYVAVNAVYACVLADGAIIDMSRVLRLSKKGEAFWHGGTWSRGAALYRAGDYAAAVTCLEQANQFYHNRAWEYCFLAMAHQQLDNSKQAVRYLSQASAWMDSADQRNADDLASTAPAWGDWHDRSVCQMLWREAHQLIGAPIGD